MRILIISLMTLFVLSCSNVRMLEKSFNKIKAPIEYLHDSRISDNKKTDSIYVSFNIMPLDNQTSVTKIDGTTIPLLFFNHISTDVKVVLGQNSIKQNYNNFFISSFFDESSRTGNYILSNQPSNSSSYSMVITVDSCITQSQYMKSSTSIFLLLAYSFSSTEAGLAAATNLKVTSVLKKGDIIINKKSYSIYNTQPFLKTQSESIDEMRSDFISNMAESLSLGTKECIEKIITDINSSINN